MSKPLQSIISQGFFISSKSSLTIALLLVFPQSLIDQIGVNPGDDHGGKDADHEQWETKGSIRYQNGQQRQNSADDHGFRAKLMGLFPYFLIGQGPGETETNEVIVPDLSHIISQNYEEQRHTSGNKPVDGNAVSKGSQHGNRENVDQNRWKVYRMNR